MRINEEFVFEDKNGKVYEYSLRNDKNIEVKILNLGGIITGIYVPDRNGILENIVLNELLKRGYKVYVGKLGNKEVDFIAEKKEDKIYIQVTYLLGNSQSTIDREFNPLLEIHDHYHKYVVSMDDFWSDNIDGVKHKNLAEFLLMEEY